MESTPASIVVSSRPRGPVHTGAYSCRLHTPARKLGLDTPRSHRLVASTRKFGKQGDDSLNFEGLLKKSWKLFSLSPLYNFKRGDAVFKKYSRSLDAAFSQSNLNPAENSPVRSYFSVYPGLSTHENDPEAVRIQVVEKNKSGSGDTIVLTAVLMCVDVDHSPVSEDLSSHFVYYPVVLMCGNKGRSETLLLWLERHFDCHAAPLGFHDNDMRWMLAMWSSQGQPAKTLPVLMQYSLKNIAEDLGISTIDCKLDSNFCKDLWERLHGDASSREEMDESQVNTFVEALESHLEYIMSIYFSKMSLSEVGTPVAYVSNLGKLKLLSASGVYLALHLICEISVERFVSSTS
ncbi:centromere protein L [Aplysia californica]|uniref:Centromere protein L n=1 Tax=Aplysia californica TaxID=6500 RepID=A0ABM0JUW2_APLCA|nr:centromere protein L [Aplysia californica]XP_005102064.1 centromere protein L [Aplysia californica]